MIGVSWWGWESVTLGAFGVMVATGVLFWLVGSVSRRHGRAGETNQFAVTEGAPEPVPPPA